MAKRRFDDVPTGTLFPAEGYRSGKVRTRGGPTRVAVGNCPRCTHEAIAVVRQGDHLVWRTHSKILWSGTAQECAASGVALCVAAEGLPPHNAHPLRCTCRGPA